MNIEKYFKELKNLINKIIDAKIEETTKTKKEYWTQEYSNNENN